MFYVMKKQPELTAITKQNIKNVFWDIFKEKPIERITVKEICQISGYNRSTFYVYFKDVYDVLNTIENDLLEELHNILNENPVELFSSNHFVVKMTEIYNTKGEQLYYLFKSDSGSNFISKYKELIKSILFVDDFIDKDKELKFQLLFEFMISAIISAISFWYPRKEIMQTSEFIEYIHDIAENGPIKKMNELFK